MDAAYREKAATGRKGKPSWNKGLTYKLDLDPNRTGKWRRGSDHPFWISDRSRLKRFNHDAKDRRSYAYNEWRRRVWKRDNFKCQIQNDDCDGRIEAHHILGWTDYPELRYEINNGITLCHAHHPRKRAEEKRLAPLFAELVAESKELI